MPGLLTLHTDLKSLKYGHDTPGGGNSGQPYITTDINTVDSGFNKFRLTKFDDGLVRGGIVGAVNASVVDTLRIGKFLKDFPKGPLFIVKQVGLQLSNPRLESKKLKVDRATSGQGFLNNIGNFVSNVAGKIENAVGPTRIYNLGINTLAQVPINAIGGHVIRHGFLPVQDSDKLYEAVVTANNENGTNRLVELNDKFKSGNPLIISEYIGGPGSVYGIGTTIIHRATTYNANYTSTISKNHANRVASYTNANDNLKLGKFFGASNHQTTSFSQFYFESTPINISDNTNNNNPSLDDYIAIQSDVVNAVRPLIGDNINDLSKDGPSSYPSINTGSFSNDLKLPNLVYGTGVSTYANIKAKVDATIVSGSDYEMKNSSKSSISKNNTIVGEQLPSSNSNPTYKNGYGEKVVINIPWNKVSREARIGSGRKDEINLTPLFTESAYFGADTIPGSNKKDNIRDLIRFRIQAVNTDKPEEGKWMVFRAYLTDLSDDVSATWNEVKYSGRGDQFWIYNGFTRKMNISFKVAALSAEEMKPMYNKLNYLMSNLMPDYDFSSNVMRGPLVRMSIGSYIDSQLGKIDSLNYKVSNDTPWEIAIDKPEKGAQLLILPHIIEVTLGFTPIGSESKGKNELPRKAKCVSNIAQNNTGDIGLQYVDDACDIVVPQTTTTTTTSTTTTTTTQTPLPPPPPPPSIPPSHDDILGTGVGQSSNTGIQHKFGTSAQEEAYMRVTYGIKK
jgi:hypothetical protein